LALSAGVGFAFKVTNYYRSEAERTILWNDPDLAIGWPVKEDEAILAERDLKGTRLCSAEVFA
jgi:dTDP-4-dehydrorhamnose 3,5-epimerase